MRSLDMGINPKTFEHFKNPLTPYESAFLGVLWVDHVGRYNAIDAKTLAVRFASALAFDIRGMPRAIEEWKRDVREMHNHLLFNHDNIPILSASGHGGGYWIAENAAEGRAFDETFRKRAKTGFLKATRGRKGAMVDLVTQMSFEWDDLVDRSGMSMADDRGRMTDDGGAPVEIVDAFLSKMMANPEKFAGDLRKLGEKYGSVLVPKKRFEAMIAQLHLKAEEIRGIAANLGG